MKKIVNLENSAQKCLSLIGNQYLEIGTLKNYEILCTGSLLNYLSNGTGPTLSELILVKW